MKIFLVGPMGSGKSKIGKLLSSKLNFNLIDIDREIEAKFKKTIVDIFAMEGEESFRKKEISFLTQINQIDDSTIEIDPDANGPAPSFLLSSDYIRGFNFLSLRSNFILKWEYRPGSSLFLVWQQQRDHWKSSKSAKKSRR